MIRLSELTDEQGPNLRRAGRGRNAEEDVGQIPRCEKTGQLCGGATLDPLMYIASGRDQSQAGSDIHGQPCQPSHRSSVGRSSRRHAAADLKSKSV